MRRSFVATGFISLKSWSSGKSRQNHPILAMQATKYKSNGYNLVGHPTTHGKVINHSRFMEGRWSTYTITYVQHISFITYVHLPFYTQDCRGVQQSLGTLHRSPGSFLQQDHLPCAGWGGAQPNNSGGTSYDGALFTWCVFSNCPVHM